MTPHVRVGGYRQPELPQSIFRKSPAQRGWDAFGTLDPVGYDLPQPCRFCHSGRGLDLPWGRQCRRCGVRLA